jgi:hypothetical protein
MVVMTLERCSGLATYGLASVWASAQLYTRPAESAVRLAAKSRPPLALSHSIWLFSVTSVARAGVL